jgi:sulfopyruvate decarboxylase subunit beta
VIDGAEAHQAVARHRGAAVVVATMGSSIEWRRISDQPDSDLLFSEAMGYASSLGLGVALALPERKVLVLDGDGSLLMNMGGLVTIADAAPANLVHFVFVNDVYRLTGRQPIPRAGRIRFKELALSAGYRDAREFDALSDLENALPEILGRPGPTLVEVRISVPAAAP